MLKLKKTIAAALSAVMLLSSGSQLLSVTADASTTDTYVIEARSYAVNSLQATYGGERVDGENLLTDVELTGSEARTLARKFSVLAVEKDIVFTGDTAEETDEALSQWNLDAIGVTAGGEQTEPARRVKIAVIDSGISYTGDIFAEESINLTEDGNENPLFDDASGHGTAVAGMICAADDDIGITGINPNAALYSAKVLDSENKSPLSRILQGIYWAIENEVDIINMSFGTDVDSEILHNAVKAAHDAGILLIASSGNTAGGRVKYPAAYSEVIAVGATDPTGQLWANTSVGDELELLAPGEKILTSGFLGGTLGTSGTSIAAAQVTGVASLLMQRDATKSAEFIRALLSASAKKVGDFGLIDYAYASEIYNDFADRYEEPDMQTESFANETEPTDYSDSAECVVEGLWGTSGHTTLINNATGNVGMTSYYTKIVSEACKRVDSVYGGSEQTSNLGKIQAFHGRGNYVANIKFVYYFAQLIGQKKSLNTALTTCKRMFPKLLKEETSGNFTQLSNNGGHMLAMANALSEIYNNLLKNNDISLYVYNTESDIGPKRRMLVFLGVMLHMIGDTYAHRTMVHTYTVKGVNPSDFTSNTSHNDKFGQSDFAKRQTGASTKDDSELKLYVYQNSDRNSSFAYWKDFQKTVRLNVMEFQDVARFTKSNAKRYDDNVKFCKERFSDANKCGISAFSSIVSVNYPTFNRVVDFNINYIFPKDDYVKLNNLKNFSAAAGFDVSTITTTEWEAHSTSQYV